MKRALTTFSNSFGLALYDREQHGVRGKTRNHKKANGQSVSWILLSPEGEVISVHEDPVDYCKAVRQVLAASPNPVSSADVHRAMLTICVLPNLGPSVAR